jgi:hypothetical protein
MESSSAQAAPWSTPHKIAFRFAFCYLFLYIFPFPLSLPFLAFGSFWHTLVPWVGAHILHLSYPITVFQNGGSDTTFEVVRVFCLASIAAIATVVWSLVDRQRPEYAKLHQWIRLYVRLILACEMFRYGGDKLIPDQMPPPSLTTLLQSFGDLSTYRLLWSYMGASPGYQSFCGGVEMLGGLFLLIPGTTLLGALISMAAMSNVLLLNIFYDVNVKLYAAHLLLFACFLLLPDAHRLLNFLLFNRGNEPKREQPLFRRQWMNYVLWGIQWAFGLYVAVGTLSQSATYGRQLKSAPLNNPLYGIWKVEEFTADGQVRPPLLTDDQRWQRVVFSSGVTVSVQEMNGLFSLYIYKRDAQNKTLSLKKLDPAGTTGPWYTEWIDAVGLDTDRARAVGFDGPMRPHDSTQLNYTQPQPDAMVLQGLVNGHQVQVKLKKEDRQFIQKTRGIHWICDEPDLF